MEPQTSESSESDHRRGNNTQVYRVRLETSNSTQSGSEGTGPLGSTWNGANPSALQRGPTLDGGYGDVQFQPLWLARQRQPNRMEQRLTLLTRAVADAARHRS